MSVSDWEKLGLSKPSGTDYEEHSAVGDVSTGRRFKAVQSIPNVVIIDDVNGDSTLMYFGESKPGTATSAAFWRIKKMVVTSTITQFSFADGDDKFDNIWDNRASLTYT